MFAFHLTNKCGLYHSCRFYFNEPFHITRPVSDGIKRWSTFSVCHCANLQQIVNLNRSTNLNSNMNEGATVNDNRKMSYKKKRKTTLAKRIKTPKVGLLPNLHTNEISIMNYHPNNVETFLDSTLERQDYLESTILNAFAKSARNHKVGEYLTNALINDLKKAFISMNTTLMDVYSGLLPFYSNICINSPVSIENPKEKLYVFYNTVMNRYNTYSYRLEPPTYEYVQFMWVCRYNISWPICMTFTGTATNKKESSNIAAKSALDWLKKNNFIDYCGKPIYSSNYNKTLLLPKSLVKDKAIFWYSTSSQSHTNNNATDVEKLTEHVRSVRTVYLSPKNTLHNFYQILSTELKQNNLKLIPQYKLTKQKSIAQWTCTYNLKWPEAIQFSDTAHTKQEASSKAAMLALSWLAENKKITKEGKPIVYDKQEVKKIIKQNYPTLILTRAVLEKMNKIENIYQNNLSHQLHTNLYDHNDDEKDVERLHEEWPKLDFKPLTRRNKPMEFYEAKEDLKLPISQYKNKIIDHLEKHRVLIIEGEPGCGKSTRVPQYALEAWAKKDNGFPGRIIVTQPRRIAAISLSERVAFERRETVGETVGFQVRLNSNFNPSTGRIMYCTTGILLRRLQHDPLISDCSHVILDEAHERDVNTDLLMNLVRDTLKANPHIKVIIMSATLEAKLFQEYFENAPILNIPGFTYPVKHHFLTESKNLSKTYNMCAGKMPTVIHEDVVQMIRHIHKSRSEGAILCFLPGWDEIMKIYKLIPQCESLSVMCLHSKLEINEQRRIFSRPPPGVRKIILATNIAETSITIDDVVYVIDTGIHKEQRFDPEKGVNCIDNYWISQASAKQRRGRAGRCQPGESFHLYPETKYHEFQPHSVPEILRTSLTKIVLDSKVYSNNMVAVEFLDKLISSPDKMAIEKAVEELKELELLDEEENLTALGKTLSEFQLEPKLSKAMVNSVIFKCVTPIIDIATLFSSDSSLFSKTLGGQAEIKDVKREYSKNSDHLSLMRMYEMWLDYIERGNFHAASTFCHQKGLVEPKLKIIQKLTKIHADYLYKGLKDTLPLADDFSDNDELVKAILLSGVGNVLQHRSWDIVKGKMKKSNVLATKHNQKATITSESVNSRKGIFSSNFLFYINETLSNLRHTTIVRESSVISNLSVLLFKNGQLKIEEIENKDCLKNIPSEDLVLLRIEGSSIAFYCDRKIAETIKRCKAVLHDCMQYYIYQLTRGEDHNEQVNFYWNEILRKLNDILIAQKLNDDLD